jgi:putative transposase
MGPGTDGELVDHIRRILAASPFPGEGYRKVWARLRPGGIRTSPRRVLRLMRAPHLLAPTRQGHPHGPKAHDGTIIPAQVETMWGTDMTTTYTCEDGQVAIFIAGDHCSAECVGIHAAKQGTRFEALEPMRHGVRTSCGACGQDIAQGLLLRHDHGSQ